MNYYTYWEYGQHPINENKEEGLSGKAVLGISNIQK